MDKFGKLDELIKVIKAQEAAGLAKAKNIIGDVKSVDLPDMIPDISDIAGIFKKEEVVEEKKSCCKWKVIICIVLAIIVIAAIVYGLYWYFTPDYLEDFEDDFEEDDFEDDLFEDEDKKD